MCDDAELDARVGLLQLIANGVPWGSEVSGPALAAYQVPVVARLATYFGAALWAGTPPYRDKPKRLGPRVPCHQRLPSNRGRSWMRLVMARFLTKS